LSNDYIVDEIDRKILYTSIGTKMKDRYRKKGRHLKEMFKLKTLQEKELLFFAQEKGFV
jgi:hypothetical protein